MDATSGPNAVLYVKYTVKVSSMVKQNAMKAKGAGGETPRILNLDNRWR
jgi:hypothetical protein